MSEPTPVLFLDFDGTISRADVVDAILDRLASPGWEALEEEWRAGRIGSRACLTGQMALVAASPDAVNAVIDAIDLDPGFTRLLETAARHGVPVHVVSDGFDYCIRRLLGRVPGPAARTLLDHVHASHLEPVANGWTTAFPYFERPCEHGCATCKPRLMSMLNPAGHPALFVGDGLSDRYAAGAADLVFAKKSLAAHCEREGIGYVPYGDLGDVAAAIEQGFTEQRAWRAAARVPASGAGAA